MNESSSSTLEVRICRESGQQVESSCDLPRNWESSCYYTAGPQGYERLNLLPLIDVLLHRVFQLPYLTHC